ncbi:EF-hand calcium-binding domain-containing protein 1 [Acromyrmex echinatior]|uniref:EF-hand calcium-binding domain-containing protein 1 n=1 Tax=Acromyrmex echinatior TaxID=103372 RepID=F4X7Y1_ACREC|nr:EF-hand calcium-binding domain-containing protein 1 [Acromyrmex echinatior]
MSEQRNATPTGRAKPGVGAGADIDAEGRTGISIRAGATLMKSVSIFLTSGRRASTNSKRQISAASGKDESSRRRRRRKMPEGGGVRNSAYIVKVIESLKKKTRLVELDSLCKLYKKLTTNSSQQQVGSISIGRRPQSRPAVERIDRTIFRELLHNTFHVITEDILVERLFCCWDREIEGAIRLEPWIMGLDVFLRGSLRDKIVFCFHVYDLNNDGYITKDEIFQLLNYVMTIACLSILWATLMVLSCAQEQIIESIIKNKNVNVKAQELTQELWKIIDSHLNTNYVTSSKSIEKDLKNAIMPLVSHNRRSGTSPPVFQVATQLDKITRRAITREFPSINKLDEEIMAKDIVADMMVSLKTILSKQIDPKDSHNRRMMQRSDSTMSDDDEQNYNYAQYRLTSKKMKQQKKTQDDTMRSLNNNENVNINENYNTNLDVKRLHRRSFGSDDDLRLRKMRNQNTKS